MSNQKTDVMPLFHVSFGSVAFASERVCVRAHIVCDRSIDAVRSKRPMKDPNGEQQIGSKLTIVKTIENCFSI